MNARSFTLRAEIGRSLITPLIVPLIALSLALSSGCIREDRGAEPDVSQEIPADVIIYGGVDHLQNWLMALQVYAQHVHKAVPAFAMMTPMLIGSQMGISQPQQIDLSGPIRWFSRSASGEIPSQNGGSLAQWALSFLFKIKSPATFHEALAPSRWAPIEKGRYYKSLDVNQPGALIIEGPWVIISADGGDPTSKRAIREATARALVAFAKRDFSPHLKVSARPTAFKKQLTRFYKKLKDLLLTEGLTPDRASALSITLDRQMELWFKADSVSFILRAHRDRLGIEGRVSASHSPDLSQLFRQLYTDARPTLSAVPQSARGLLFLHLNPLEAQWLSALGQEGSLRPSTKGVVYLDDALELSSIFSGEIDQLRGYIRSGLRELKSLIELRLKESTTPKVNIKDSVTLKIGERRFDHELDLLSATAMTSASTSSPNPEPIERLIGQLGEVRVLYTPRHSYMTFGARSEAKLNLLYQLNQSDHGGILSRQDFKPLTSLSTKLTALLYISAHSIEETMHKTIGLTPFNPAPTAPASSPTPPSSASTEEGLSLALGGTESDYFLRLTLPLGVSRRVISSLLVFKNLLNPPQ